MIRRHLHGRRRVAALGLCLALVGLAAASPASARTDPRPPSPTTAPGNGGLQPPAATCFGRAITAYVPPGGADFYGSDDPAVIDVIQGTAGEDRIFARAGHDFVCGGDSYDHIEAGPGNDWIDGQLGGDSLYGGPGADVIYGGAGGDLLLGDEGSDLLFGEREDDELSCDLNPAVATGGISDVADGGLGANDNLLVGDVGCESVVNVEYP